MRKGSLGFNEVEHSGLKRRFRAVEKQITKVCQKKKTRIILLIFFKSNENKSILGYVQVTKRKKSVYLLFLFGN